MDAFPAQPEAVVCFTSESYKLPIFGLSKYHYLDVSASNYHIENEFTLMSSFRHRWHQGNHNRDEVLLVPA